MTILNSVLSAVVSPGRATRALTVKMGSPTFSSFAKGHVTSGKCLISLSCCPWNGDGDFQARRCRKLGLPQIWSLKREAVAKARFAILMAWEGPRNTGPQPHRDLGLEAGPLAFIYRTRKSERILHPPQSAQLGQAEGPTAVDGIQHLKNRTCAFFQVLTELG